MPTDTPTDRAALEALAEQWRLARGATPSSNHEYINGLLDAGGRLAATLRALAARAEPPADVAALVEEAEMLAKEADNRDACEAVPGGFDARVAATLRALSPALAARVIELEDGLQRIADAELDWTVGAADNVERLRRIARAALETPNAD